MVYINDILYEWLSYQWKISNHSKYQHYFEQWVINLTDAQIVGFEKMRVTKL